MLTQTKTQTLQCQDCAYFRHTRGGTCLNRKFKKFDHLAGYERCKRVSFDAEPCGSLQIGSVETVCITVNKGIDAEASQMHGKAVYEYQEYIIQCQKGFADIDAASWVAAKLGSVGYSWHICELNDEF